MNRTQKLLQVAEWLRPEYDWKVSPKGLVVGVLRIKSPGKDALPVFNLTDRKTRQDTLMKLREHGWFVEERKGYWLGYTRDGLKVETPTLEALVWDLVGRVKQ